MASFPKTTQRVWDAGNSWNNVGDVTWDSLGSRDDRVAYLSSNWDDCTGGHVHCRGDCANAFTRKALDNRNAIFDRASKLTNEVHGALIGSERGPSSTVDTGLRERGYRNGKSLIREIPVDILGAVSFSQSWKGALVGSKVKMQVV